MIYFVHLYQVYDASDKTTSIDRTTFTLEFICDLKQNLNGLHELKSWNGQSRDLPTVVEKKNYIVHKTSHTNGWGILSPTTKLIEAFSICCKWASETALMLC